MGSCSTYMQFTLYMGDKGETSVFLVLRQKISGCPAPRKNKKDNYVKVIKLGKRGILLGGGEWRKPLILLLIFALLYINIFLQGGFSLLQGVWLSHGSHLISPAPPFPHMTKILCTSPITRDNKPLLTKIHHTIP